jgi:peptidyl-prolyl cis-trans isomerase SurA
MRPDATSRHPFLCLTVLAAAFAVVACGSTSQTPAAPPVSADAWAVVDGREITSANVDKAFRRVVTDQVPSEEEAFNAKLGILDDLILEEILLAKARALKIEVPAAEIDTAYENARKNMTGDQFQQELTKRNLTPTDMREGLQRQLTAQKLLEQEVTSKVTVTDQQIADFFNANRAQFNLPEDSYRVAQIIVTPVRDQQIANRTGDDAATPQAAQAKVQMLMERLKGGAAFGDLAMDFSEDPESAPRGGDLGLVPLSAIKQAPAPLRDAVLQTTPGSARIVNQNGVLSVVFVVGREPAGQRDVSMPAVRQQISDALKARKEQLLRTAYLTSARADANVVNLMARKVVQSGGMPAGTTPAPSAPAPAAAPK